MASFSSRSALAASLGMLELHDAASLRSAVGTLQDVGPCHRACLPHEVLEVLPGGLVRQVAHEQAGIVRGGLARPVGGGPPPPPPPPPKPPPPPASPLVGLDEQVPPHEGGAVELPEGPLRVSVVHVLDQAASLGPAVALLQDLGVGDVPGPPHVVLEVLPRHLVREVPHEDGGGGGEEEEEAGPPAPRPDPDVGGATASRSSLTKTWRPPRSASVSSSHALLASEGLEYSTRPHPFDRPSGASRMVARRTLPHLQHEILEVLPRGLVGCEGGEGGRGEGGWMPMGGAGSRTRGGGWGG